MRVLAIDPGYDRVGFAVLDKSGAASAPVCYSDCFITSRATPFYKRLYELGTEMERLIARFAPTACAIEKLFFTKNQKTAMGVAEARGALMYIAARHELPLFEYTPLQIKVAVTGDGSSDKKRVAFMVERLAVIDKPIKHDDEYDALAIALTCLASERF